MDCLAPIVCNHHLPLSRSIPEPLGKVGTRYLLHSLAPRIQPYPPKKQFVNQIIANTFK